MKSPQELLRQLEIEVRTYAEKLPIDTFLPSPESLPSDFSPTPMAVEPAQARELVGVEEDLPRPQKRTGREETEDPSEESPDTAESLQDEVHEFMSRNQPAQLEEEEDSDLLRGFDPNSDLED